MNKKEAAIQRAIVRWIKDEYPNHWIKVCAPQNENSRMHADMGMDKGCPDLILSTTYDDVYHVFYLELKASNGRLLDSQKKWAEEFEKHYAASNTSYDVAYGFKEAKIMIDRWVKAVYC